MGQQEPREIQQGLMLSPAPGEKALGARTGWDCLPGSSSVERAAMGSELSTCVNVHPHMCCSSNRPPSACAAYS